MSGHASMYGGSHFIQVADVPLRLGPFGVRVNVDSIALDRHPKRADRSLFYGAVTSASLFRVSAHKIQKWLEAPGPDPTPEELGFAVVGPKPVSDGLSSDLEGRVWITAFAESALTVAVPAGLGEPYRLVKVVENSELLRWPDGLSFGPDGLYVTNSAIHLKFSGGNFSRHAPFHILKVGQSDLKKAFGGNYRPPPSGH